MIYAMEVQCLACMVTQELYRAVFAVINHPTYRGVEMMGCYGSKGDFIWCPETPGVYCEDCPGHESRRVIEQEIELRSGVDRDRWIEKLKELDR